MFAFGFRKLCATIFVVVVAFFHSLLGCCFVFLVVVAAFAISFAFPLRRALDSCN